MLKRALLGSALALLLFSGCSDTKKEEEASATQAVNQMVAQSSFHLQSLEGETFSVTKEANNFILEGAESKVVLFDVFGTWCPPCRAEAPHLTRLQKKYSDTFKIIAVPVDENPSNALLQEWKQTYGADYSIVNSKDNRALANALAASVNAGQGFPIPLMLMFKDGIYVTHYVGAIPEEMIESDIKHALGK